ncbi:MAG: hypothetical protein COT22_06600 [Ignavibacteria bacterium CG08_land_8_20_14_0_20_37_9]|nr:MAG: hypothetical protein COT22_06600 [Ignavibacteria bacterium CG08_land_8_20_14_0_20_37_9]
MIDSTLKNANILIVDDQQANIDILVGLLELKGYTNIKTITDSRLAVSSFKEFKPDLLLLDLMMPYLNGFQVMEQLGELVPAGVYFPILVLTADITTEAKLRALGSGAKDFLTKPLDLIEVDLRIKNMLLSRFLHQQVQNENQILDGIVKERTLELEKTIVQLSSAKDKAEEMNRVKSYFFANMSHELRTPLISIIGFADLLKKEITNKEHLELVNYIAEGGRRLNETVSGILDLTNLETEQSFLMLKPANLVEEINRKIPSFRQMTQHKNLFLKTDLADKYLESYLDSELFGKALYHLVNNAIKFTNEGGILIALNLAQKYNRDWAVIRIIDTGTGIPKENLGKIFQAFRQSSEGLNRAHEGTGLGLTITKKIIDLMKGFIEVESEIGKGSIFSIWLPTALDESKIQSMVESERREVKIKPPTNQDAALLQILLVEDNSANRILIKRMLEPAAKVTEAENGITGISIASQKLFDLILMDINLGFGIDGIETMNRIRKIQGYTTVPIIALTAYAMPGDRKTFLEKGFDEYINKPFLMHELLALTKTVLKKEIFCK